VPNLITNAAPGELFIIRNVGNIVPVVGGPIGGVTAAIEYAVDMLEIDNVIVCGHTNCGAIDAILHPETVAHLPAVSRWINESSRFFQENFEERYGKLAPEARMTAAVQENVLVQLENLRTVECVARKLDAGTLKMSGWVFTIATGEVFDYDPVSEQFLKLGGNDRSVLSSRPPSIT
jgi:carbonic anhydrase